MLAKKDIPNLLTNLRIAAIPLIILAFLLGLPWVVFLLFAAASITDFFDGYLARKWQVTSKFGAMLDQISDKLLVCAVLLCLVSAGQASLVAVAIIIFREILVSGLREFMGNEGIEMPVSKLGKWKTATQLVAITLLLLSPLLGDGTMEFADFWGGAFLWVAAILGSISGLGYWKAVKSRFI